MLQAKTVMKRNVITVRPQDTLDQVIQIVDDIKITGLPVVNEDDSLVGIISRKDIIAIIA